MHASAAWWWRWLLMGRVCFVFKPMPWVLSLDAANISSNNLCSDYEKCRKAAFGFWVKRSAAAGGASISFQGKNVTRLPEGQRTWPKLLQIDKTFLTLWCYFCFACNAYCPSAHPAAAACLASCPLFQWPCPFIILSLFVPPPLHPAPILTVGIKAHHFGLVWCYTEDKKHIVRFFVEIFQSCLITLLQTNSATFLIPAITGCFIQDSFSMPPPQRRILLLCLLFH